MHFLADECCDASLVHALRNVGHDVFYVMESSRGISDNQVLALAVEQERILLTEDKDFGELIYRQKLPALGVILLRFNPGEESIKVKRLVQLVHANLDRIPNNFIVIDKSKISFLVLKEDTMMPPSRLHPLTTRKR